MNGLEDVAHIYDLLQTDARNRPRSREHWHASELAKCPREQYLARKGADPIQEMPGGKQLRFQVGFGLEAYLQTYLRQLYPKLLTNVRITSVTYDLTGEFDAYDPDSQTVFEIKSTHPWALYRVKKSDPPELSAQPHLLDQKPYPHHEWQTHAYALLMADSNATVTTQMGEVLTMGEAATELGLTGITAIKYLYWPMGSLLISYDTPVKPVRFEEVQTRLRLLNEHWDMSELPDCLCGDHDNEMYGPAMQYCSYKTDWNCCQVAVPSKEKP